MKNIYRILIASPQSKDRKQLEALLASQPYELVLVSEHSELSKYLNQSGVDLFILDTSLTGIDPFEITKKVKVNPVTCLVPVILICSLEDKEKRSRGIEAGCDDFISKPFDRTEVQTRIDTILKLNYVRSALEGQAKFDSLFDYMDDGIVLLDNQLQITRVNEKARDLLKIDHMKENIYFPERLLRLYKVSYEGDLGQPMRERSLRFDIERPETESLRPLILELRSNVIKSAFRDISGIIVTLDDVTEIRNKVYKEEQFLNFISHKLQTPLAIVNKNATLFQKNIAGPLSEDQKILMNAIYEKSSELVESFEKLIQFMAVKNRQADLFNETIALDTYLPEQAGLAVKREKKKKVDLKVECETKGFQIRFDKKHLTIILQNLIENAIKFGDKDPVAILVSARKRPDENVEILIEDNGPGIPPEERENIFKPFYQVDKHRTGNIRGTGLGLAIVQHLISSHGGMIEVRSDLGKNTAFLLTLPAIA